MPRGMPARIHEGLICSDAQEEDQSPANQVPNVMRLEGPGRPERRV
jgi:hypothetical protein